MIRISLQITQNPPQAEVIIRFLRKDGSWLFVTATVDTGAEITFLPEDILNVIDYNTAQTSYLTVERAGIRNADYKVTETIVTVQLEDAFGNISQPFEMPIWFGQTKVQLFGMTNAIQRGVLHLDMPSLSGYIELP